MKLITYRHLELLEYPVYKLDSENWEYRDGLLFLDTMILDDRNVDAPTIGLRRLQTPFKTLYPLKRALEYPIGLIKNPTNRPYIDNKGRLFIYEKTRFVHLISKKIRKIERRITNSLIWVGGVSFPFEIKRAPKPGLLWANILYVDNMPWLIYSFSPHRANKRLIKI